MSEEISKSFFNAGMAQAERIDSLQRTMNAARFNPLALNQQVNKWNYEIMQSAQDSLLKECWGKLTPEEKIRGQKYKRLIEGFLEYFPVITKKKDEIKIHKDNYKKFMEIIDLYENTIKVFLEVHDLNSPNKDLDDEDEL